jgi:hypothetical protein
MPRPKRIPQVNAAAHAKVMARLSNATPEELVQGLVRAGIVTKSGRFTAPYREFESLPKVKRPKTATR